MRRTSAIDDKSPWARSRLLRSWAIIVPVLIVMTARADDRSPPVLPYDSVPALVRQLSGANSPTVHRTMQTLVEIGEPAVDDLCRRLEHEDRLEIAARICQLLGRIGDRRAAPAVLAFIERDLDEQEAQRRANEADPSVAYDDDRVHRATRYQSEILPAVAAIGDERAIDTILRLHDVGMIVAPALRALKTKASIPVLAAFFSDGVSPKRTGATRTEATAALLVIDAPVGAYLLRDWERLEPAERRRRMRTFERLADERRTARLLARQRPPRGADRALEVFRLTNTDLERLRAMTDDDDRHVRYHLARLLRQRLAFHEDDEASRRALVVLAADDDPSVMEAAREGPRRKIRDWPRLGTPPRRVLEDPPVAFAIEAAPLEHPTGSLRLSLERASVHLDAPDHRFNDPLWVRLELRRSPTKPPEANVVANAPWSLGPDLRQASLLIWDAHGKERRIPLWRRGVDHRCYVSPSLNLLQCPGDRAADDFTLAYVNLMEFGPIAQLAPGDYVLAAEFGRRLTGRIAFSVTSSSTGQRPLRPSRRKFNRFADDSYARVKWRTQAGRAQSRQKVIIDDERVYVSAGWDLKALSRDDGTILWTFRSTTGGSVGMRLVGDRLVVKTTQHHRATGKLKSITEVTLESATGDWIEQRDLDLRSNSYPYEKGGFRHIRELPFGQSGQRYLVAKDGTVALWSGTEVIHLFDTIASDWYAASPDGTRLYGGDRGLGNATVCLELATGRELWRVNGIALTGFARRGDTLYGAVGGYGKIAAIDARTGELKWSFPHGANQGRAPVVDGPVVYAGAWRGSLWALDAEHGHLLWRIDARGSGRIWSPVAADGVVYYVDDRGYCYAVENRAAR